MPTVTILSNEQAGVGGIYKPTDRVRYVAKVDVDGQQFDIEWFFTLVPMMTKEQIDKIITDEALKQYEAM